MDTLLVAANVWTATWYVNGSSGANGNSGLADSSAKATIQAAIDAASAGDTILVSPGAYDAIYTQGKAITIRSALAPDGATPPGTALASGDGAGRHHIQPLNPSGKCPAFDERNESTNYQRVSVLFDELGTSHYSTATFSQPVVWKAGLPQLR